MGARSAHARREPFTTDGTSNRDPDASDRRVYTVHLTADGRRTLGRAGGEVLQAEQRFLATLGSEEERFERRLRRLLDEPTS